MENFAIVVHAGAGADSEFIKKHKKQMEKGLADAAEAGYAILKEKGHAKDAVEAAVRALEDNPLFNAGRGAAINNKGQVELCASIMDGETLNAGAVAIVQNVKNPVSLARAIMDNTKHIYLGSAGAIEAAMEFDLQLEPDSYFVTEHQYEAYAKERKQSFQSVYKAAMNDLNHKLPASVPLTETNNRMHGTVGAVAVDQKGNVAAATSTGGTPNAMHGRIGDSSMVGVGSYANNETCAVSGTGDGEYLIRGCICNTISNYMKFTGASLEKACRYVVHAENKGVKGDIGIIAVSPKGEIAIEFNSERLLRAWKKKGQKTVAKIY
jgi:beta-aspartyl-peptidase (threonine type)